MNQPSTTAEAIRSIVSAKADTAAATDELLEQLNGFDATVIVFFAAPAHDGRAISRRLRERFPAAQVIGCSSAGEFSERGALSGGISALALSPAKIARAAARLVDFKSQEMESGIRAATAGLAAELKVDLRNLDPKRYVGILLIDGLSMREERANEVLGDIAPTLSFVGGSAGDDLQFRTTHVVCNGEQSDDGAALLLLESAVPFIIGKTCSFVASEHSFKVTKADVANRTVYEFDGRPVLDVYAEALGVTVDKLTSEMFMSNPVGLMIDGEPWIRSPQRVLEDRGLKFFCNIQEGMQVHVMRSTDLVEDTRSSLERAEKALGSPIVGGIAFNCVLRRLEMDARDLHKPFLANFRGLQVSGFHTYGETWLGHMNQTLTSLWFA